MLGANYSLYVFGVGFQLYGQLKKSLHDGIMLPANLQQKVAFDTYYTNEFLIRICSRALSVLRMYQSVMWNSEQTELDLELMQIP